MAGIRNSDGSFGFSGGVDSSRTTTVQSEVTPDGLPRNMLAWLGNATVRGGGIHPRAGWKKRISSVVEDLGIYQGGWVYVPNFNYNPYLITSIAGRIYKILLEAPYTVTDLSSIFSLTNPPSTPKAYFCQGEEFLVIQAGDNATLPLFWDGTTLRRSVGLFGGTDFPVTMTSDWIVPTVGNSVTLNLSAPYGGNVNDQITIKVGADVAGVFLVTGSAGNDVTVKTISTAFPNSFFTTFNNPYHFIVSGDTAELPAATAMCYYMNRLWYAQGRQYCAGDIVGGPSGTAPYKFRDSILKVTESQFAAGGDGFTVPSSSGTIRALSFTASIDNAFGQGSLYPFTRKSIYRLTVPITREDWTNADSNNQPLQTVAQQTNGTYSDRSLVSVNGDVFYKSIDGIRSLSLSVRNFGQWGNTPISNNENRVFQFEDRSLLNRTSGITFDNRLFMTCLPKEVAVGVASQGIIPLDFDLISTLQEKRPPAWEGMYEGLLFLQLFEGDFGGLHRAFALTYSEMNSAIQLWELTSGDRFDDINYDDPNSTSENENRRIEWYFETPAYTWGKEWEKKKLTGAEIWIDKIVGTVQITVEYRPDADVCWYPWLTTQFCVAKSSCEDVKNPTCYPEEVTNYREGFKFPLTLGNPPMPNCNSMGSRPSNVGFQFQSRVTVKGYCRIRGVLLFAEPLMKAPYENIAC